MKFYGIVGFAVSKEIRPSVYADDIIVEREYKGELTRRSAKWSQTEFVNDDLTFPIKIQIVEDPFAREHFSQIKFVVWNGAAMKVTSIDASEYPKLILEVGGTYNGPRASDQS